jgi:hypothetical protein
MREQVNPPALVDASQHLDEPPTDDDLDDLLESAAPRRRSKLTTGLIGVLIFVFGFFLGSTAEKVVDAVQEAQAAEEGEDPATTLPQAGLPILTGTIQVIEDGIIYVERADGAVVKVQTEATTLVGLSEASEVADLAPGDEIFVHGERAEDGTVAAKRIQQAQPPP